MSLPNYEAFLKLMGLGVRNDKGISVISTIKARFIKDRHASNEISRIFYNAQYTS